MGAICKGFPCRSSGKGAFYLQAQSQLAEYQISGESMVWALDMEMCSLQKQSVSLMDKSLFGQWNVTCVTALCSVWC